MAVGKTAVFWPQAGCPSVEILRAADGQVPSVEPVTAVSMGRLWHGSNIIEATTT
jgi:hypothetical protein